MANVSRKSTVLGLMKEVTENTLLPPTGATKFIAVQPGFDMSPQFDQLENQENRASIAPAQSATGNENPTATIPQYIRGSGVVGTQPNYGPLVEAAFGAVDVETTQYDTVASSTAILVKVDTGEGANYRKGQALRVQYTDRAHSVRAVHSISGDNLVPSFQLPAAPGTGINLGKSITYYPQNENHPTVSLVAYGGNGGLIEAESGGRVTNMQFTAENGQYINGSFSVEALKYYFNPLTTTSALKYIDFTNDDGTFAAAVAEKTWADPHELAAAIQAAMNTASPGETATVTYSDTTGKFTIASTGVVFTIEWNTGTNTANTIGTLLGFSVAADDSGALTYTSDGAISLAAGYTPTYDSANPIVAKNQEVMVGDQDDFACFNASRVQVNMDLVRAIKGSICAESGRASSRIVGRNTTVQISALIDQYSADFFRRYRSNTETRFQLTFGEKEGGNWVAGKTCLFYLAHATVSEHDLEDVDGQYSLNLTLKGFAPADSSGEVFFAQVD